MHVWVCVYVCVCAHTLMFLCVWVKALALLPWRSEDTPSRAFHLLSETESLELHVWVRLSDSSQHLSISPPTWPGLDLQMCAVLVAFCVRSGDLNSLQPPGS